MKILLVIAISCSLKLLVAWLMYLFVNWIGMPEWGVITLTTIGEAKTKVQHTLKNGVKIG